MKKTALLNLAPFFLFLCFTFNSHSAQACVDPDSIVVRTAYDTTYQNIAITVSNIRLFTASPTQFCSCAITSFTNVFSNILYVAFVDSGTTNPVGFKPWTQSANASSAWESVISTGNWNGFVSQIASATSPGTPVELIIRAELPAGYTFSLLDSAIVVSRLGTDEWDNDNQTLSNSHQEIYGFWERGGPSYTAISPDSSYFDDLDNNITTSISRLRNAEAFVSLFPNPATDRLRIEVDEAYQQIDEIRLLDIRGRAVRTLVSAGSSSMEMDVDLSPFKPGVYLLEVHTDEGILTRKLVIE